MRKPVLWTIVVTTLIGLAAIVAHGIIVPKALWADRLALLTQELPGYNATADRVVLALSSQPALMVSGLTLTNPATGERWSVGLLRIDLDGWQSLNPKASATVTAITVKGLSLQWAAGQACESPLSCLPPLLSAVARHAASHGTWAGLPQPTFRQLARVELNQTQLNLGLGAWQGTTTVDEWVLDLPTEGQSGHWRTGWRLQGQWGGAPVELTGRQQASIRLLQPQEGPWTLELADLNTDASGTLLTHPWTFSLAGKQVLLTPARGTAGGLPILRATGQNLRAYLRRDDAPDEHQAAWSSQSFQGGFPLQPWHFRGAEWTYTHEEADAWSFNLKWDPASTQLDLEPETVEGSEAKPVTPQRRSTDCSNLDMAKAMRPSLQAVWAWVNGWFELSDEVNPSTPATRLCLQATL